MAITAYAPSTSGTVTTSFIPLTTTYSSAFGDAAATNYLFDGRGFSAWLWDKYVPGQNFWSQVNLPPEVTAAFMSTAWVHATAATKVALGPFAACPGAFFTAGVSAGATTCCPSNYGLYLGAGGGSTSAYCTSTFSASQTMTYAIYATANGEGVYTITYPLSTTTNNYTQGLYAYTAMWSTSDYFDSDIVVTAPGIVGWNFGEASNASTTNAAAVGSASCDASTMPTGAIAGLAVTSVLAGIGLITAVVFGWMLLGYRRRSRENEQQSPTATPSTAFAQTAAGGTPVTYAGTASAYKLEDGQSQAYYSSPPMHELSPSRRAHELGPGSGTAEME